MRKVVIAGMSVAVLSFGCAHPLKTQIKSSMLQMHGCAEEQVEVERVRSLPENSSEWKARGCGKEAAYFCEPREGNRGWVCSNTPPDPTGPETPEEDVRQRMAESYGCASVAIKKLGEQTFRADGCKKRVMFACGVLPGKRGYMCAPGREESMQ